MADVVITLAEARKQGLSHYFTGKPCKAGHVSLRSVSRRSCMECDAVRSAVQSATPQAREYQRAYREKHKEHRSKLIAEWAKANREKRREDNRRWYYKDTEHSRALHLEKRHRRRKIALAADGSHTKDELAALLVRQGHRCAICRADLRRVKKHADHIHPLSLGGADSIANIQYLCAPCNLSKGAKDPIDFAQERGFLL